MNREKLSADDVLHRNVDLNELIERLSFSDEETVEAARIQPSLFLMASIFRVQKMRRRHRLEARLKLERSQNGKKYRKQLVELGQRVTDKQIEEKLSSNPDIKDLEDRLDKTEQEEEFSKLLLEAMRMRGQSLKVVAELVGAEVYVSRRLEGSDTQLDTMRKKLKEKYPGRVAREERRENK